MRIAVVQMDIKLADQATNLANVLDRYHEARELDADLIVFPECTLTGYAFDSLDELRSCAQPLPCDATTTLTLACQKTGGHVIVGLIEEFEGRLFNCCVIVGPNGIVGRYRKAHLPFIGADRFCNYGDELLRPYTIDDFKIGLHICYDAGFPEVARVLALQGADLLLLPTNWPPGAIGVAEHIIPARAIENTVYCASASRVGVERGVKYLGLSKICDPFGKILAAAKGDEETILYAEIDPQLARTKHLIRTAGLDEINRIADRRPELYQTIMSPKRLPRPGNR